MPNNTRIPFCPFYKDEKNKSISCEDTYHVFSDVDEKYAWMDMYCDEWDWQKCPYAIDLTEAYARLEKGDEKALENQKIEAMQREMKSLSSKLGRAEKRVKRQQKKIDELRAINQSFIKENQRLEGLRRDEYAHRRTLQDKLDKDDAQIFAELQQLSAIYEQRMCYLIDKFADGFFCESDVERWAGDREFALVRQYDEDLGDMVWKVVFKEDESNECEGIPGDDTEPEPETEEQQVQQCQDCSRWH